jgi:sigma-B regulation protein RsbU (phosphoserine phosphatase)
LSVNRDRLYLVAFLLGAGGLLFAGRDLLQGSVLITWGLTFGGTTAVVVLGVSLYRVRLDLRASRTELARKEAELSFALQVQLALFPRQFPASSGLEFTAVCIPAHGISGDYYDVIQLQDGRLVFAIADISGKGISAAILMANLQALLRALVGIGRSPGEVVSSLNHHLNQVTDDSRFATFFYGEWSPQDRRLSFVNAGHLPPIVVGSCGGRQLDKGGLPLGLFRDTDFEVGELTLQPGDMLVLYSDGITEATSDAGEQFEEHRLQRVVEERCGAPLPEIQSHILDALRKWSDKEPEDDMTLLIVRATTGPRRDDENLRLQN